MNEKKANAKCRYEINRYSHKAGKRSKEEYKAGKLGDYKTYAEALNTATERLEADRKKRVLFITKWQEEESGERLIAEYPRRITADEMRIRKQYAKTCKNLQKEILEDLIADQLEIEKLNKKLQQEEAEKAAKQKEQ